MRRTNSGVTLIALIITIIVLLILAGVTIAMVIGDNGILNRAVVASERTKEAEEKDAIGIAYNGVMADNQGTGVSDTDLQTELINNGYNATVTDNGDGTLNVFFTDSENYYNIDQGIITKTEPPYQGLTITAETEGIIYTDKDGNEKELTEPVEDGDIVKYEDYEYRYNSYYYIRDDGETYNEYWQINSSQNGWGVKVINQSKSEYSEIGGLIFDKPVVRLSRTFEDCINLIDSPQIPTSVTNMEYTFYGCTVLVTAPTIPDSVTDMSWIFSGCTALVTAPIIPDSVTNMDGTFAGCTALKKAPIIPDSVTTMSSTFVGCTALTTAPIIPSNVVNMNYTFQGCTNLTGNIIINSDIITTMARCFKDTEKPIILLGSNTTILNYLMSTANNGNVQIGTIDSSN